MNSVVSSDKSLIKLITSIGLAGVVSIILMMTAFETRDKTIGFTCNKFGDTIIGDKCNIINIEGTYKSPSWVNQEMCRCIDEFMISYLEYGIQNL